MMFRFGSLLRRQFLAFVAIYCAQLILFAPIALRAQPGESAGGAGDRLMVDRYSYNGSFFLQGFSLGRDLPLVRPEDLDRDKRHEGKPHCFLYFPEPGESIFHEDSPPDCKDRSDFARARFRLNNIFRPSTYATIHFGIEVGDLYLGEPSGTYGPGSGAAGGGATNIETQELYISLHNHSRSLIGRGGIFSFSTPNGLVMASSGAGVGAVVEDSKRRYRLESVAFLMQDNSRIGDNSSGFSSENYRQVRLGAAKIRYDGWHVLRPELYGVVRVDGDDSDRGGDGNETSRLGWAGLYLPFRFGPFGLMFHGAINRGYFERPQDLRHLGKYERLLFVRELERHGFQFFKRPDYAVARLLDPWQQEVPRHKQYVSAAAGEAEFSYRINDYIEMAAAASGASGRLGNVRNDGRSLLYDRQRWRSAGGSIHVTDIAGNTSGGYAIFAGGNLRGALSRGGRFRITLPRRVELHLAGYHITSIHPIDYRNNRNFTQHPFYIDYTIDETGVISSALDFRTNFIGHPGMRGKQSYIGKEWNFRLRWTIRDGMVTELRAAQFRAGDGYLAWKDVLHGSTINQASLALTQSF